MPDDDLTNSINAVAGGTWDEIRLGNVFARARQDRYRYVARWDKWMVWEGQAWREDQTRLVYEDAVGICRTVAETLRSKSDRNRIASTRTVAAVLKIAGACRTMAATTSQWNADKWAIATPGGVVDLRTGVLRDGVPEDYITRSTSCAPGGECPQWRAFVAKVCAGDEAVARYMQKVLGYCLTGVTSEHAFWFLYGTGRNGKSQMLIATAAVMGDYHAQTQIDVFIEQYGQQHPTELAALDGARLVTSSEPDEGKRWNESRIKALTGGEAISARFMRGDHFNFTPQCKLIFNGNAKPSLRSVNVAITERMRIVPFTVRISAEERIPDYGAKLAEEEGPGILSWLVEGCLAWQREGLATPEVVTEETTVYMTSQDSFRTWFEECVQVGSSGNEGSATLFESWKAWCERRNEHPGTHKAWGMKMHESGRKSQKDRHGTHRYAGLSLASEAPMPF